jgi:hypothetical protein
MVTRLSKQKQKIFGKNGKKRGKTTIFFNHETEPDPDRKPTFEQKTDPDPDRLPKKSIPQGSSCNVVSCWGAQNVFYLNWPKKTCCAG